MSLFANYLHEAEVDDRQAYLPTISGWQDREHFEKTVFVIFDIDEQQSIYYGYLYLSKEAIMQSDGQTQTVALFKLSRMIEHKSLKKLEAFERFFVSLEIELNVDEEKAAQSFAKCSRLRGKHL